MQKNITLIGAGLVGSLLSMYLAKRGHKVDIFEKRSDMRKAGYVGGRSINLALSHRGFNGLAALDLFDEAGIENLRAKSIELTNFMQHVIQEANKRIGSEKYKIITPIYHEERGCQLSIICKEGGKKAFDTLTSKGIIGDWREPEVLRFAPVPLYNSFEDVWVFGQHLN